MKAVVCAVMITLVMTSTVFAGTIGDVIKVRGVATYTKTHLGDVGYYTLAGNSSTARTTAINNSTGEKWFQCFVYRKNHATGAYDYQDVDSRALWNGETLSVEIDRDLNSRIYNYEHTAKGYSTPVYINGALVDNYTLNAKQYYED